MQWFWGYCADNDRSGESFTYRFSGPYDWFFSRTIFQKLQLTWNAHPAAGQPRNFADYQSDCVLGLSLTVLTGAGDTVQGTTATNLGLPFYNNGQGGDSIADVGPRLFVGMYAPNIGTGPGTAYLLEGGINDAAQVPTLSITIFSNLWQAEAAYMATPFSTVRNISTQLGQKFGFWEFYNNGSYNSIHGSFVGSLSATHWNYDNNTYLQTAAASTNTADYVQLTNVFGTTLLFWYPVANLAAGGTLPGALTPGSNVVYKGRFPRFHRGRTARRPAPGPQGLGVRACPVRSPWPGPPNCVCRGRLPSRRRQFVLDRHLVPFIPVVVDQDIVALRAVGVDLPFEGVAVVFGLAHGEDDRFAEEVGIFGHRLYFFLQVLRSPGI